MIFFYNSGFVLFAFMIIQKDREHSLDNRALNRVHLDSQPLLDTDVEMIPRIIPPIVGKGYCIVMFLLLTTYIVTFKYFGSVRRRSLCKDIISFFLSQCQTSILKIYN